MYNDQYVFVMKNIYLYSKQCLNKITCNLKYSRPTTRVNLLIHKRYITYFYQKRD